MCFNNIDIFLREFLLPVTSDEERFAARKCPFRVLSDCARFLFRRIFSICIIYNASARMRYTNASNAVSGGKSETRRAKYKSVTRACFKINRNNFFFRTTIGLFVLKALTITRPNRLVGLNERIKGRKFTIA